MTALKLTAAGLALSFLMGCSGGFGEGNQRLVAFELNADGSWTEIPVEDAK
ncbi:MAG: hypothetical protein MK098_00820 [Marinovum sp.]|nr:hypothetical protein [Marinovum sp.]